jgi:Flp pilus assembly protein TadG
MTKLDPLKSHIGRSWSDRNGSIAVVWTLVLPVLLLALGGALDLMRWHQAQATTSEAVDAAVLAGGLALQLNPEDTIGAVAAARTTYAANVARRTHLISDAIDFAVDPTAQVLSASGTTKLPTTVLSLFGMTSLNLYNATGVKSQVTTGGPGGSNLEVAAMLDVTGSMCDDGTGPCTSGTKIDALKVATTRLVNIVVRPDQSVTTTKVAFIPFSTRIRLAPDGSGAALLKQLTNLDSPLSFWYNNCTSSTGSGGSEDAGNWACSNWVPTHASAWQAMPCVTERVMAGTFDVSDDPPGPGKWLNAHDGSRMPLSWDSTNTAPTSALGGSSADPSTNWNYDPGSGYCADIYPGSEIVPLTSDKTNLLSHIGTLQAYGGTAGALAASWTWYMLSPNWSSMWTGNSTPAPYSDLTAVNANGAPKLRKVVIMETDGGFNVFQTQKGYDQQTVSNYAVSVCNAMKAKGIEIYTVGFMLNTLPASEQSIARATLQACGTDVQHFYDSLNAGDLEVAFNNIGVKLSGLRLIK